MTRLIVTADDFGLCAEVNDAICQLHDRGVVQRASVIVNTEHFESSVEALRSRPSLEAGIHLNLTDGRPVLPAGEVATLVNGRGSFRRGRHYTVLAHILGQRRARDDIRAEWRAQVAKMRRAGIDIKHLNAHGHLHLLPQLREVVLDLLEEFAIAHVRLVLAGDSPRGLLLRLCSRGMVHAIRRRGLAVTFPDRILGLGASGALTEPQLLKELTRKWVGVAELVVHPALGDNSYHRRWRYAGETEMRALLSEKAIPLLRGDVIEPRGEHRWPPGGPTF
jgi:predicted glycoside hydrolase/deacetylase ChbG (UPF0249 family)